MNKKKIKKIIKKNGKRYIFYILFLVLSLFLLLYLIKFEWIKNDEVKTNETKSIKTEESINEINNIPYIDFTEDKEITVRNNRLYLGSDYKKNYKFIDDFNIDYDNDDCNRIIKVDKEYEYKDYLGVNHKIKNVNNENIKDINVGDYIYYGTSDEERKIIFRVVDIKDGVATLHSVFAFDSEYGCVLKNESYKDSTLRTWLNDEFYNKAFTEEEKNRIIKTKERYDFDDYIYTLDYANLHKYYSIQYYGYVTLKPKSLNDEYVIADEMNADSEYKPSNVSCWITNDKQFYSLKAIYDKNNTFKSDYVIPFMRINIGNIDNTNYRLPDIDFLNLLQRSFILNNDLYFLDDNDNFIRISNYNGEKTVQNNRVDVISDKVKHIYKVKNRIYFMTNMLNEEKGDLYIYENGEKKLIMDNAFYCILFSNDRIIAVRYLDNITYDENDKHIYYAYGQLYEYKNNTLTMLEETKKQLTGNNKRLIKDSDINKAIEKNVKFDDINILLYVKDEYNYIKIDNEEYKYGKNTNQSIYQENKNSLYFVEKNNIGFVTMYDKVEERYSLYAIYKENGKSIIKEIDRNDGKIYIMYVSRNKLYYYKMMELKRDYYSLYGYTVCSYEFGNEKKDLYYVEGNDCFYSCEIDTVFFVDAKYRDYVVTHSLYAINKDGVKLVEDDLDENHMYATPYGVYFTNFPNTSIMYYDTKKKTLIENKFIYNAHFSSDYRFAYIETMEYKYANLSDYISPLNPDEQIYKDRIGDNDINDYIYRSSSVYVLNKDKVKLLSENAHITNFGDQIIFTTYKKRKVEKVTLEKMQEIAKEKSSLPYIGNLGNNYLGKYLLYCDREIAFNYLFDGDKGTRINIDDSHVKISNRYEIKGGKLIADTSEIYFGDIKYDGITNLYKYIDGKSIRISYVDEKDGELYIYYYIVNDASRKDYYCYNNGKVYLILENVGGAIINKDTKNNIYIKSEEEIYIYNGEKPFYKIVYNDDKVSKEIYDENIKMIVNPIIIKSTYDEVKDKGFYYENDDEHSKVGKSFFENNDKYN